MSEDQVPVAEYPEGELLKYKITPKSPVSDNGPKDNAYINRDSEVINNNNNNNDEDEAKEEVVIIKKSKKKYKIQVNPNTPSSNIRRHISESSWNLRYFYKHIHWKNLVIVILVPLVGISLFFITETPLITTTFYWSLFNYFLSCLSVSLLYHKCWSHQSITITNIKFVKLLAILSSSGGITSGKNWCSSHRAHHRYCDTERDPYNIRRGLLFSHFGWMILIYPPKVSQVIKECKLDELPFEEIADWQVENYFYLFISTGLIIPSLISYWFWNDFWGGLIYSGFLKIILVQHSNFLINSIGHTFGTRPFDDRKSPRNNFLLSFLTFGEGNQNFHHEFAFDYRNGNDWFNYDPTKWTINILKITGLITNVKKANSQMISKSLIQQQQKLIDNKRSKLNWGIPIEKLPLITPENFRKLAKNNPDRYLIVVSGTVHDVTPFAKDHPGGLLLIKSAHGKDATQAFDGAVYSHSNAARNLLATMRIGVLVGSEKLYWKQQRIENKTVPIDNDSDGNKIVRSGEQVTFSKVHGSIAGAA